MCELLVAINVDELSTSWQPSPAYSRRVLVYSKRALWICEHTHIYYGNNGVVSPTKTDIMWKYLDDWPI